MYESLAWAVAAVAFCSLWAVQSWVSNRRQEREAYYRSEAIKKVAEMQGHAPEAVLALLREALTPPPAGPSPWASPGAYVKEREAYYRSETLRRLAESPGGGAEAMLQLMREEENRNDRRVRGGLRLGGMVLGGVGIGCSIFLRALIPDQPIYLAGLMPMFVGMALLVYSFLRADNDGARPAV